MHNFIANVAKILGVCVLTAIMYTFLFGTSNFFVFDGLGMGGYDGAIAMVVRAVEKPMAEYYRDLTYKSNEYQMDNLQGKVSSNALYSYKP